MRTELTSFEVQYYRQNSFVAIQDFLDDDDLEHWRNVVDKAVQKPLGQGLNTIRGRNLSAANPDIAALWRSETVGGLVAQAGGFDAVRHLGDLISYAQPGEGATPWHCNMHEEQIIDSADALSLYVVLDEYRWYNMALSFLPAAHRIMPLGVRRLPPLARNAQFGSLLDEYPALKGIEPLCVEGRAGMAIIFNLLGVHGTGPNLSPRVRRMTSATFCRDGEVANGVGRGWASHASAGESTHPLPAGSPLTDAQAPLIWRAR